MHEPDLQDIGRRLAAYRKELGLTQAQAAEAANISEHTCSKIERGASSVNFTTLFKICSALNISINDLYLQEPISSGIIPELQRILLSFPQKDQKKLASLLKCYLQLPE